MPMEMQHWPTEDELGGYYMTWLKMAAAYTVVAEFFDEEEWFLDLESFALRRATHADGVLDMVAFIEVFFNGLAVVNFEVYMIVRRIINFFN